MERQNEQIDYREEYHALSSKPIQKRAKGMPFRTIAIHSINAFLIFGVFYIIKFQTMRSSAPILFWSIGLLIGWLFLFLPEWFYDDRKRTTRYSFRKYPLLRNTARKLRKPDNGETLFYDFPVLIIDKQIYFLASYLIRQQWWNPKPKAELTGWILIDAQGRVVKSTSLFSKAFLTLHYAYLGSVEIQKKDDSDHRAAKDALRYYIPHSLKDLRRRQAEFEAIGCAHHWQQIMEKTPVLIKAVEDSLSIYKAREDFRRGIGYSFGLKFYYDDAVLEEKMNRAFSSLIVSEYRDLTELAFSLNEVRRSLNAEGRWNPGRKTLLAITRIWIALQALLDAAQYYRYRGIPNPSEWNAYVLKLGMAEKMGLTVVDLGDFSEEYPFKR